MDIIKIVNDLINMIPGVEAFKFASIIIPAVAAILAIFIANSGKRLLNWIKLAICVGGGYYVGSVLAWPYIAEYVSGFGITDVIAGIVLAVVFLVLGKYAYAVVFAGALGYGAYLLLTLPEVAAFVSTVVELNPEVMATLTGNALWIAVGVGVVALVFRGLCETIVTSVAGGVVFAAGLYTAVIGILNACGVFFRLNTVIEVTVLLVVAILVCLGGYLKQVKNRHRF